MKRILTILTAAALLLCSCSRGKPAPEPTGATYQLTLSDAWRSEPVEFAADAIGLNGIWRAGDCILIRYFVAANACAGLYDPDSGSLTPLEGTGCALGAAEHEDGFSVLWDLTERTENYEISNVTLTLADYDKAGNPVSAQDVTGMLDVSEGHARDLQSWCCDAAGNHYTADAAGTVRVFAPDLTLRGEIQGVVSFNLFSGTDGAVYCEGRNGYAQLFRLDPDALDAQEIPLPQDSQAVMPGDAAHPILCCDAGAMYSMDPQSGEAAVFLRLSDSDLPEYGICDAVLCSDGTMFGIMQERGSSALLHLTRRTQEELAAMQIISAAAFNLDDATRSLIQRYNRQSDRVHIAVQDFLTHAPSDADYETHYQECSDAFDRFEHDMISGIVPDLFFVRNADYEALSNKGLFEDWLPWMEQDPEFHREDYFTALLDSLCVSGRQERLCFSGDPSTLCMKAEYLPEGFDGSVQAKLSLYENPPAGMTLFPDSYPKSQVFGLLTQDMDCYIDRDAGTCSFDSPEFIRILKICNQAPDRPSARDSSRDYVDDKALLRYSPMGCVRSWQTQQLYMGTDEIALPGFVMAGGNGAVWMPSNPFAVNRNSLYKEEIWDFIKFGLREDNQIRMQETADWTVPVLRSAAKQQIEAQLHPDTTWQQTLQIGSDEVAFPDPDPMLGEQIMEWLDGISAGGMWTPAVVVILQEESERYFAGDCTAEECARAIESRVTLYLSELS